jgi:glutaredoxin
LSKNNAIWISGILLLSVILAVTGLGAVSAAPLKQAESPIYIYFFWGDGCPRCAEAEPFLKDLVQRYPNVQMEDFEVWYNTENQAYYQLTAAAHGFQPRYVPAIFIGDQHWEGFSVNIGKEIETAVRACVQTGCIDAGAGVIPGHPKAGNPSPESGSGSVDQSITPSSHIITVPWIGQVDVGAQSLWASTALISFVDGFNPCSLWVLSILIALTLRTGSRKKIFFIGLTFITVTALVYVLFIAGLFTMLTFISFLGWIQAAVSLLALFFAVINIKDYFWYKEGLSLTIDDTKKPGLYKRMRRVLQAGDSLTALLVATVGLGFGVSLVEFSCTAGFPVLWTNLVAAQNVTPLTFALLLLLYMFIYQIDEIGIFLTAVITLRVTKLEEKHGRILKLIGGTLMLTLAAVMLINPALLNDLMTSIIIFTVAFSAAMLIMLVHRVILPRVGISIGTEAGVRSRADKKISSNKL